MIYCLHGFLGRPQDWIPFEGVWKTRSGKTLLLEKSDLWSFCMPETPALALPSWAERFNALVSDQHASQEKPILMGYSMGGRLALHLLEQKPELWRAAIFVSTHPGLSSTEEKQWRLSHDRQWAARFRSEDWASLMRAWNDQPVFANDQEAVSREEHDYDRQALAAALESWSLGYQRDFSQDPSPVPTLWISGERDEKFTGLARKLQEKHRGAAIEFREIPGAGHRVPWEAPQIFGAEVQRFLNNLP